MLYDDLFLWLQPSNAWVTTILIYFVYIYPSNRIVPCHKPSAGQANAGAAKRAHLYSRIDAPYHLSNYLGSISPYDAIE
jgi:hypothetical protein